MVLQGLFIKILLQLEMAVAGLELKSFKITHNTKLQDLFIPFWRWNPSRDKGGDPAVMPAVAVTNSLMVTTTHTRFYFGAIIVIHIIINYHIGKEFDYDQLKVLCAGNDTMWVIFLH